MKTSALPILAALAVAGAGLYLWQSPAPLPAAHAQDDDDKEDDRRGTLTITGTATTHVKPDSARVFFRVESYDEDIKAARADNAKQVDAIMKALTGLQIEGLKMKSTDVSVQQVTRRDEEHFRLPQVLGYHVTHSFTVLVENGDSAELARDASRVLDAALENGATGVEQISFFAKDMEEARRQLLTQAVEDAMDNARALAAGANRTIDEIVTIHGQPQYGEPQFNRVQNTAFVGGAGGTPLVAGDLVLTCNVTVSCKYDN